MYIYISALFFFREEKKKKKTLVNCSFPLGLYAICMLYTAAADQNWEAFTASDSFSLSVLLLLLINLNNTIFWEQLRCHLANRQSSSLFTYHSSVNVIFTFNQLEREGKKEEFLSNETLLWHAWMWWDCFALCNRFSDWFCFQCLCYMSWGFLPTCRNNWCICVCVGTGTGAWRRIVLRG